MRKQGFFNEELPKLSAKDLKRAEEFDKRESGIAPNEIAVDHSKLNAHLHSTRKQQKRTHSVIDEETTSSYRNGR